MTQSETTINDAEGLKCEMASEILRSFGTLRLRVTGWSMLPAVWPGDTLIVERIPSNAVSEGDIVLFGRDRRLFAHRVVTRLNHRQPAEILARGDANPAPDPPVPERDLLGRVSFIVRNGKSIKPSKTLPVSDRALAALAQRSDFAARLVVGVHGMRAIPKGQTEISSSQV